MIKLVECPRDAWQALPRLIPVEEKRNYLRKLIEAGFKHIDAASFVSSAAVPQMADSENVLETLTVPPQVELIGIVVNERGAHRAVATQRIATLGYPCSVSPTFLLKNQHQTPDESFAQVRTLHRLAEASGLALVVYVSMAFGNPYEDEWSVAKVLDCCRRLADCGVTQLSLADTVGLATPNTITELVGAVVARHPQMEIGVHLHTRPTDADALIQAAYAVNCRRFDGALGGHGGCPFAQDELVGNIPTEVLLRVLGDLGATLPELHSLNALVAISDRHARELGQKPV